MSKKRTALEKYQSVREELIPLLIQFGVNFDPINKSKEVNTLVDETIDLILEAIEKRLPKEESIDQFPDKVSVDWILNNPADSAILSNRNGHNKAIKAVRTALLGEE